MGELKGVTRLDRSSMPLMCISIACVLQSTICVTVYQHSILHEVELLTIICSAVVRHSYYIPLGFEGLVVITVAVFYNSSEQLGFTLVGFGFGLS